MYRFYSTDYNYKLKINKDYPYLMNCYPIDNVNIIENQKLKWLYENDSYKDG